MSTQFPLYQFKKVKSVTQPKRGTLSKSFLSRSVVLIWASQENESAVHHITEWEHGCRISAVTEMLGHTENSKETVMLSPRMSLSLMQFDHFTVLFVVVLYKMALKKKSFCLYTPPAWSHCCLNSKTVNVKQSSWDKSADFQLQFYKNMALPFGITDILSKVLLFWGAQKYLDNWPKISYVHQRMSCLLCCLMCLIGEEGEEGPHEAEKQHNYIKEQKKNIDVAKSTV